MKSIKFFLFLILLMIPMSCATIREDYPDPEPDFASEPGVSGPLADLESAFASQHGTKKSGFLLLENNAESLEQSKVLQNFPLARQDWTDQLISLPAQSSWQRVQDIFFKLFPKEYY
jgi:hypothetical protein